MNSSLAALAFIAGVAEGASVLKTSNQILRRQTDEEDDGSNDDNNRTTSSGGGSLVVPSLVYGSLSLPLTVIGASPSIEFISVLTGREFRVIGSSSSSGALPSHPVGGVDNVESNDYISRRSSEHSDANYVRKSTSNSIMDEEGRNQPPQQHTNTNTPSSSSSSLQKDSSNSTPSPSLSVILGGQSLRDDNRRTIQAMRDNRRQQQQQRRRQGNDNDDNVEDGNDTNYRENNSIGIPARQQQQTSPSSIFSTKYFPSANLPLDSTVSSFPNTNQLIQFRHLPTPLAEGMRRMRILLLGSGIVGAIVTHYITTHTNNKDVENRRMVRQQQRKVRDRVMGRDSEAVRDFVECFYTGGVVGGGSESTAAGGGGGGGGVAMRLIRDRNSMEDRRLLLSSPSSTSGSGSAIVGKTAIPHGNFSFMEKEDGGSCDSSTTTSNESLSIGIDSQIPQTSCVLPILCAADGGTRTTAHRYYDEIRMLNTFIGNSDERKVPSQSLLYWSLDIGTPGEEHVGDDGPNEIPFTKSWLFGRNSSSTNTTTDQTNLHGDNKRAPLEVVNGDSGVGLQDFLLLESDVSIPLQQSIAAYFYNNNSSNSKKKATLSQIRGRRGTVTDRHDMDATTSTAAAQLASSLRDIEERNVDKAKVNSHKIRYHIDNNDNNNNNNDDDGTTSREQKPPNNKIKNNLQSSNRYDYCGGGMDAVHIFINSSSPPPPLSSSSPSLAMKTSIGNNNRVLDHNVFVNSLDGIACAISTAIERIESSDKEAIMEEEEEQDVIPLVTMEQTKLSSSQGTNGIESEGNNALSGVDDHGGKKAHIIVGEGGRREMHTPLLPSPTIVSSTATRSSISDPIFSTVDRIGKNIRQIGQATVRTKLSSSVAGNNAIGSGGNPLIEGDSGDDEDGDDDEDGGKEEHTITGGGGGESKTPTLRRQTTTTSTTTAITRSSISNPVFRNVDRIGKNIRQIGQTTVRTITAVPRYLANVIINPNSSRQQQKRRINIFSDDTNTSIWLEEIINQRRQRRRLLHPGEGRDFEVHHFNLIRRRQKRRRRRDSVDDDTNYDYYCNPTIRSLSTLHPDDISLILCSTDDRTINTVLELTTSRPDIDPRRLVSIVQNASSRQTLRMLVDCGGKAAIVPPSSSSSSPTLTSSLSPPPLQRRQINNDMDWPLCVTSIHDDLFAYARYLLTKGYSPTETECIMSRKLNDVERLV